MSNNVVILSGWLQIERVQAVDLGQEGTRATPVIHAWVYTDKPYLGGKHPVLLSGEAAQAALEWARDWPPNTPLPQVIAQGNLVSRNSHSKVNVRKISFMGSIDPAYRAFMGDLSRLVEQKNERELHTSLADLLRRNAAVPFLSDGPDFTSGSLG
jgi:hypothetical protein